MGRLLDEDTIIKVLEHWKEAFKENSHHVSASDLSLVIKDVRELPPAQPEPQWILCDERMPEEHEWIGTKKFGTTISDEVYVTFENEKGERFCQHMKFQNGELSRYDQFHMETWFKGSKPIAWMPLPEPYKPNKKQSGKEGA